MIFLLSAFLFSILVILMEKYKGENYMKTNEEILKGMKCCFESFTDMCSACPYQSVQFGCRKAMLRDIEKHIQLNSITKDILSTVTQAGEKVGVEKAWEIARKIFLAGRPGGIPDRDFQAMFHGKSKEAVFKMEVDEVLKCVENFEDLLRRYEYARNNIVPGAVIKHNGLKKIVTCVTDAEHTYTIHAIDYKGETTVFPYDPSIQATGARVDVSMFLRLLS